MTTGTVIIKDALQNIGAHSIVSPASPEAIDLGMKRLNSMLEMWLTKNIEIGFTPLKVPGDELNETPDTTNGIVSQLSLLLAPDFSNGKQVVSAELVRNARIQFNDIKNLYKTFTIPKKVVSSTLPLGAGNRRGRFNDRVFKSVGGTVNG